MKHGLILGIAAAAVALVLSALFVNWESGPGPGDTALPNIALEEGRAATATDPANPSPVHEFPTSLLD
ncbi:hypothetical protein IZ6_16680 [Terrihabitans soli]|uniref:Uncharacterized protein n=1 Tax=Terrihabitans soli TaxID=708113 RepID=A0A6S6QI72_9HYPH|nr:hypothetical protein [Terrihabitans soli]BCJ90933.1 hypothetical protein IZ6_16680 [Terrihabitans soli]